MPVDLKSWERRLHAEGFLHTYVWRDDPDVQYGDHTHPAETAHVILDGEMRLTHAGRTQTYVAGGSVATFLRAPFTLRGWVPADADT